MLLQVTLWRGLAVLTKQVILLVETSPIHHNLGIRNVSFMAGCGGGGGGLTRFTPSICILVRSLELGRISGFSGL